MEMDENRKRDKIEEIEKYMEELEPILPTSFEDYKIDLKIRAICERYFEKIVEAVVDLAFVLIKEKKLKIPKEDEQSFEILKNANIISENLAKRLRDAKGMRNIITHEYGKVDDELVFHAVTKELIWDVREFLKSLH